MRKGAVCPGGDGTGTLAIHDIRSAYVGKAQGCQGRGATHVRCLVETAGPVRHALIVTLHRLLFLIDMGNAFGGQARAGE